MVISLIPIAILLLVVAILLIIVCIRKRIQGSKLMLSGINITIIALIMAVKDDFELGGAVYPLAAIGLIISIIGLLQKN